MDDQELNLGATGNYGASPTETAAPAVDTPPPAYSPDQDFTRYKSLKRDLDIEEDRAKQHKTVTSSLAQRRGQLATQMQNLLVKDNDGYFDSEDDLGADGWKESIRNSPSFAKNKGLRNSLTALNGFDDKISKHDLIANRASAARDQKLETAASIPNHFIKAYEDWEEEKEATTKGYQRKPLKPEEMHNLLNAFVPFYDKPFYSASGGLSNPESVDPRFAALYRPLRDASGQMDDPAMDVMRGRMAAAMSGDLQNFIGYRHKSSRNDAMRARGLMFSHGGLYNGHEIELPKDERDILDLDQARRLGLEFFEGKPIEEAFEAMGGVKKHEKARMLKLVFASNLAYKKAFAEFQKNLGSGVPREDAEANLEIAKHALDGAIQKALGAGFARELIQRAEDRSFLGKVWNAVSTAWQQGQGLSDAVLLFQEAGVTGTFGIDKMLGGKIDEEFAEQLVNAMKESRKGGTTESLLAYQKEVHENKPENLGAAIGQLINNPAAAAQLFIQSLSMYLPPAFSYGLKTVPAGAAIGLVTTGGAGVLPGAGYGLRSAFPIASFTLSYVGKIMEDMEEMGVDVYNPRVFMEAWNSPEIMKRLRKRAVRYAGGVTMFDAMGALGAGRIGKLLDKPTKFIGTSVLPNNQKMATFLKTGIKAGGELAFGSTTSALGEYVGQQWSKDPGEELDYAEIAAEFVLDVGPGMIGASFELGRGIWGNQPRINEDGTIDEEATEEEASVEPSETTSSPDMPGQASMLNLGYQLHEGDEVGTKYEGWRFAKAEDFSAGLQKLASKHGLSMTDSEIKATNFLANGLFNDANGKHGSDLHVIFENYGKEESSRYVADIGETGQSAIVLNADKIRAKQANGEPAIFGTLLHESAHFAHDFIYGDEEVSVFWNEVQDKDRKRMAALYASGGRASSRKAIEKFVFNPDDADIDLKERERSLNAFDELTADGPQAERRLRREWFAHQVGRVLRGEKLRDKKLSKMLEDFVEFLKDAVKELFGFDQNQKSGVENREMDAQLSRFILERLRPDLGGKRPDGSLGKGYDKVTPQLAGITAMGRMREKLQRTKKEAPDQPRVVWAEVNDSINRSTSLNETPRETFARVAKELDIENSDDLKRLTRRIVEFRRNLAAAKDKDTATDVQEKATPEIKKLSRSVYEQKKQEKKKVADKEAAEKKVADVAAEDKAAGRETTPTTWKFSDGIKAFVPYARYALKLKDPKEAAYKFLDLLREHRYDPNQEKGVKNPKVLKPRKEEKSKGTWGLSDSSASKMAKAGRAAEISGVVLPQAALHINAGEVYMIEKAGSTPSKFIFKVVSIDDAVKREYTVLVLHDYTLKNVTEGITKLWDSSEPPPDKGSSSKETTPEETTPEETTPEETTPKETTPKEPDPPPAEEEFVPGRTLGRKAASTAASYSNEPPVKEDEEIFKARKEELDYTNGQRKALRLAADMVDGKHEEREIVIAGYAGTGKTTVMENIIRYAIAQGKPVVVLAPSFKALQNIKDKIGDLKNHPKLTLSSVQGATQSWDEQAKVTRHGYNSDLFPTGSIMLVDESSMIGDKNYGHLQEHPRAIYFGDDFQLPPVEGSSSILQNPDVTLTEVKRQGLTSKLFAFLTALRNLAIPQMLRPQTNITEKGDLEVISNRTEFDREMGNAFKKWFEGGRKDEDSVGVISGINKTRSGINKFIRQTLGFEAGVLADGEQLMTLSNGKDFSNAELVGVTKAIKVDAGYKKGLGLGYKSKYAPEGSKIKVQPIPDENFDFYEVTALKGDEEIVSKHLVLYDTVGLPASFHLQDMVGNWSEAPTGWQSADKRGVLSLSGQAHISTFGYAITAHKAQGSQWNTVFVVPEYESKEPDASGTWARTEDADEMEARWLYTAVGRAQTRAVIGPSQGKPYAKSKVLDQKTLDDLTSEGEEAKVETAPEPEVETAPEPRVPKDQIEAIGQEKVDKLESMSSGTESQSALDGLVSGIEGFETATVGTGKPDTEVSEGTEVTNIGYPDLPDNVYDDRVTGLAPNQVFVFGSNPEGRHGAGAAKKAMEWGAEAGKGEGRYGQTYAIPTKDLRIKENNSLRSISAEDITASIKKFYEHARENTDKQFLVANYAAGTNLNGYTGQEMADMFSNAGPIPDNVVFERGFSSMLTEPTPTPQASVPWETESKGDRAYVNVGLVLHTLLRGTKQHRELLEEGKFNGVYGTSVASWVQKYGNAILENQTAHAIHKKDRTEIEKELVVDLLRSLRQLKLDPTDSHIAGTGFILTQGDYDFTAEDLHELLAKYDLLDGLPSTPSHEATGPFRVTDTEPTPDTETTALDNINKFRGAFGDSDPPAFGIAHLDDSGRPTITSRVSFMKNLMDLVGNGTLSQNAARLQQPIVELSMAAKLGYLYSPQKDGRDLRVFEGMLTFTRPDSPETYGADWLEANPSFRKTQLNDDQIMGLSLKNLLTTLIDVEALDKVALIKEIPLDQYKGQLRNNLREMRDASTDANRIAGLLKEILAAKLLGGSTSPMLVQQLTNKLAQLLPGTRKDSEGKSRSYADTVFPIEQNFLSLQSSIIERAKELEGTPETATPRKTIKINFKHTAAQMKAGTKTQTARSSILGEVGDVFTNQGVKYELIEVLEKPMGDIEKEDFKAEGFDSPEALHAEFMKIGFKDNPLRPLYVYRFKPFVEAKVGTAKVFSIEAAIQQAQKEHAEARRQAGGGRTFHSGGAEGADTWFQRLGSLFGIHQVHWDFSGKKDRMGKWTAHDKTDKGGLTGEEHTLVPMIHDGEQFGAFHYLKAAVNSYNDAGILLAKWTDGPPFNKLNYTMTPDGGPGKYERGRRGELLYYNDKGRRANSPTEGSPKIEPLKKGEKLEVLSGRDGSELSRPEKLKLRNFYQIQNLITADDKGLLPSTFFNQKEQKNKLQSDLTLAKQVIAVASRDGKYAGVVDIPENQRAKNWSVGINDYIIPAWHFDNSLPRDDAYKIRDHKAALTGDALKVFKAAVRGFTIPVKQNQRVSGGAGVAIQMALVEWVRLHARPELSGRLVGGKPPAPLDMQIDVFDQSTGSWFFAKLKPWKDPKDQYGTQGWEIDFVEVDEGPTLIEPGPLNDITTAIGTREMTLQGRKALEDVFRRTFPDFSEDFDLLRGFDNRLASAAYEINFSSEYSIQSLNDELDRLNTLPYLGEGMNLSKYMAVLRDPRNNVVQLGGMEIGGGPWEHIGKTTKIRGKAVGKNPFFLSDLIQEKGGLKKIDKIRERILESLAYALKEGHHTTRATEYNMEVDRLQRLDAFLNAVYDQYAKEFQQANKQVTIGDHTTLTDEQKEQIISGHEKNLERQRGSWSQSDKQKMKGEYNPPDPNLIDLILSTFAAAVWAKGGGVFGEGTVPTKERRHKGYKAEDDSQGQAYFKKTYESVPHERTTASQFFRNLRKEAEKQEEGGDLRRIFELSTRPPMMLTDHIDISGQGQGMTWEKDAEFMAYMMGGLAAVKALKGPGGQIQSSDTGKLRFGSPISDQSSVKLTDDIRELDTEISNLEAAQPERAISSPLGNEWKRYIKLNKERLELLEEVNLFGRNEDGTLKGEHPPSRSEYQEQAELLAQIEDLEERIKETHEGLDLTHFKKEKRAEAKAALDSLKESNPVALYMGREVFFTKKQIEQDPTLSPEYRGTRAHRTSELTRKGRRASKEDIESLKRSPLYPTEVDRLAEELEFLEEQKKKTQKTIDEQREESKEAKKRVRKDNLPGSVVHGNQRKLDFLEKRIEAIKRWDAANSVVEKTEKKVPVYIKVLATQGQLTGYKPKGLKWDSENRKWLFETKTVPGKPARKKRDLKQEFAEDAAVLRQIEEELSAMSVDERLDLEMEAERVMSQILSAVIPDGDALAALGALGDWPFNKGGISQEEFRYQTEADKAEFSWPHLQRAAVRQMIAYMNGGGRTERSYVGVNDYGDHGHVEERVISFVESQQRFLKLLQLMETATAEERGERDPETGELVWKHLSESEKQNLEEQNLASDYIIAAARGQYALDQTTSLTGVPIGQATHPVLDLKYWFKLGVGKQSEAHSLEWVDSKHIRDLSNEKDALLAGIIKMFLEQKALVDTDKQEILTHPDLERLHAIDEEIRKWDAEHGWLTPRLILNKAMALGNIQAAKDHRAPTEGMEPLLDDFETRRDDDLLRDGGTNLIDSIKRDPPPPPLPSLDKGILPSEKELQKHEEEVLEWARRTREFMKKKWGFAPVLLGSDAGFENRTNLDHVPEAVLSDVLNRWMKQNPLRNREIGKIINERAANVIANVAEERNEKLRFILRLAQAEVDADGVPVELINIDIDFGDPNASNLVKTNFDDQQSRKDIAKRVDATKAGYLGDEDAPVFDRSGWKPDTENVLEKAAFGLFQRNGIRVEKGDFHTLLNARFLVNINTTDEDWHHHLTKASADVLAHQMIWQDVDAQVPHSLNPMRTHKRALFKVLNSFVSAGSFGNYLPFFQKMIDDADGHRKTAFKNLVSDILQEKMASVYLLKSLEPHNKDLAKSLIAKIRDHAKKVIDYFRGRELGSQIEDLLDKTVQDFYYHPTGASRFKKKDGYVKVDLAKVLSKDPVALKWIKGIANIPGIYLTGSPALSLQGNIYRPKDEQIHDLDFSSSIPHEEAVAKIEEWLNSNSVQIIRRGGISDTHSSWHVMKDGRRFLVEILNGIDGPTPIQVELDVPEQGRSTRTQNTAPEGRVVKIVVDIPGREAETVSFMVSHFSQPFEAKLGWLRAKDILDIHGFKNADHDAPVFTSPKQEPEKQRAEKRREKALASESKFVRALVDQFHHVSHWSAGIMQDLHDAGALHGLTGKEVDDLNVIQKIRLYFGKTGDQLTDLQNAFENPMLSHLRDTKWKDALKIFGDYAYARYAPVRHKNMVELRKRSGLEVEEGRNYSGLSEKKRKAILADFKGRDAEGKAAFKKALNVFDAMNRRSLRLLRQGEILSKDGYARIEKHAKNEKGDWVWAPLRGLGEKTLDVDSSGTFQGYLQNFLELETNPESLEKMASGQGTGQGFSETSGNFVLAAAKGRYNAADSKQIMAHAIRAASETIIRTNKNEITTSIASVLARVLTKGDKDAREKYAKIARVINPNLESHKKHFIKETLVEKFQEVDGKMVKILEKKKENLLNNEDLVLTFRKEGEPQYILFKDTELGRKLVRQFKNADNVSNPNSIATLKSAMGFFAQAYTVYSPNFVVSNMMRDVGMAWFTLSSSEATKDIANSVLNPFNISTNIKAMVVVANRESRGEKIPIHLKALIAEAMKENKKGGSLKSYADDMDLVPLLYQAAGGRVSFFGIEDVDQQTNDMARRLNRMGKTGSISGGLKAFNWLKHGIKNINTGVENGVRLQVFREAIKKGMSMEKAAALSRDVTVDFNRKGNHTNWVNALWLFFNASVQGNYKLIRALFTERSPQAATVLMAKFVAGAAIYSFMSRMWAGDDDETEENHVDRLSDYERDHQLQLWLEPGTGKHVKIHIPYGLNSFLSLGRRIGDVMWRAVHGKGGSDPMEAALGFWANSLDVFNPLGAAGHPLISVTPHIARPLVNMAGPNVNYMGNPIYPDKNAFGANKTEAYQHFTSVNPLSRELAHGWNSLLGGDVYEEPFGGTALGFSPETLDEMVNFFGGGMGRMVWQNLGSALRPQEREIDDILRSIPIASAFYRHNTQDYNLQRRYFNLLDTLDRKNKQLNIYKAEDPKRAAQYKKENLRYIKIGPLVDKQDKQRKFWRRKLEKMAKVKPDSKIMQQFEKKAKEDQRKGMGRVLSKARQLGINI